MSKKKPIYEVKIKRENGDEDTIYVCMECLLTTSDFLKVKCKKIHDKDGICDRCN